MPAAKSKRLQKSSAPGARPCADDEHLDSERRAYESLRAAGLKRTRARAAVIAYLAHRHGPFTVDEIHRAAAKALKAGAGASEPCDLATIYRILAKFEEAGVTARVDFGDGVARFEIAGPAGRHHHHVICLECGRAAPVQGCDLLTSLEDGLRRQGFTSLRHRLEFFAVCPDCAPPAR